MQAWLTLATVRRVQGRLDASSRACDGLAAAGADFHARACRAENVSLRGDADGARAAIEAMLAAPGLSAESRNWVLTSLAQSAARAGRADKAEAACRQAQTAHLDAYTAMSYADFLLERKHPREALAQLKGQQRTDAVLLRLAIAGTQAGATEANADVQELRERILAASLRPEARTTHARELAMFALWIDKAQRKAVELAREIVKRQREALDLLVFAQSAAASKDTVALREVAALKAAIGLHDKRLDALLSGAGRGGAGDDAGGWRWPLALCKPTRQATPACNWWMVAPPARACAWTWPCVTWMWRLTSMPTATVS